MVKIVQMYQSDSGATFTTEVEAHQDDLRTLFKTIFGDREEGQGRIDTAVKFMTENASEFANVMHALSKAAIKAQREEQTLNPYETVQPINAG
jgi:glutamine synthetase adenylyltransferase